MTIKCELTAMCASLIFSQLFGLISDTTKGTLREGLSLREL